MTRNHLLISLVLGLIVVAAVPAIRWRAHWQQTAEWQAELEATQRLMEPLETIVTLQFEDGTPLSDWLAEFTRQSGIPVEIFADSRQNSPAALMEISTRTPTQLRVPPLRAREFLSLLGDLYAVPWTLRPDGSVIIGDPQAQEDTIIRQLPTPAVIPMHESTEYFRVLSGYSRLVLAARSLDQASDHHLIDKSGLTIIAPPKRIAAVERFGRHLVAAHNRTSPAAPRGTDPSDPRFRPEWLEIEADVIDHLYYVLERPISLNVVDMPWHDLTAEISRQVQFPVIVHPKTLYHFQQGNVLATCRVKQVPLRKWLEYLPAQDGLALFPAAGGKVLVLGARSTADQDPFRLLAAYPVDDLAWDDSGRDCSAFLQNALAKGRNSEVADLFDPLPKARSTAFAGRLLLVSDRLDGHRQIQRLLAAIRTARNQRVQRVSLPDQYDMLRPELQAILERPISLQYANATLADVARDQRERGFVPLTPIGESRVLFKGQSPIWCYLPERPLGENLTTLFAARGHHFIEQRDELQVRWREQVEQDYSGLACEVFDLRPWLAPQRPDDMRVWDAVAYMTEPGVWNTYGWNGRGSLAQFGDLLIVRCEPRYLPRIHELLKLLIERVRSPEPNFWRGKVIAGDELNRPLTIWPADEAALAREAELRHKLLTPASANFQRSKLGDALLALASRHQLPVVLRSVLPNNRRLDERITYQATDKPLGEILQEMVGDPDIVEWHVGPDCLTIVELLRPRLSRPGYWYSIADLVRAKGAQRGELLERMLDRQSRIDRVHRDDRVIRFVHNDFLWLDGNEDDRPWLENQLRRLRGQPARNMEEEP